MSIKKKLYFIVFLTLLEISVTIWGVFQLTKGAKFHQLNFLHWKHNSGLERTIRKIDPAKAVLSKKLLSELEQSVQRVRAQPIECLNEITFFDKLVMKLIGTDEVVLLCEKDIRDGDNALVVIEDYKHGKVNTRQLVTKMKKACTNFINNSNEFEKPVVETVNFIFTIVVPMILLISTFNIIFIIYLSSSISNSINQITNVFEAISKDDSSVFFSTREKGEIRRLSRAAQIFKDKSKELKSALYTNIKIKEKLEIMNSELTTSNNELEKFAYVTSHDLKAPLRGISDLVEYMEEDLSGYLSKKSADPNIKKNLDRVHGQIERMNGLIDGILEYSKVGKEKYLTEEIDTGKLVRTIFNDQGVPKGAELKIESTMPVFFTDQIKLGQVFSNLIDNAFKYHNDIEQAKITVGARENEEFFEFYVSDNGPGISSKFHKKIFEIFQTLQSRDDIESTGIGLSIIQKLVELYGGEIKVYSVVGQGSTFRFTWPKDIEKSLEKKIAPFILESEIYEKANKLSVG